MHVRLVFIPILLIGGGCGGQKQDQKSLQERKNSIFTTRARLPNTTPEAPKTMIANTNSESVIQTEPSYIPCGINNDKICVPQYLCQNETINEYGHNIIDVRNNNEGKSKDNKCPIMEKCCATGDTVENITSVMSMSQTQEAANGCGFRNENGLTIKNKNAANNEAEFGEFPWMVAIMQTIHIPPKNLSSYKCGGSLIAPDIVLTAAHCVYNMQAYDLTARAGEWETNSYAEPLKHQDIQVRELISHENFNNGSLFNDIALLFLEAEFDWAPHINTICLPPPGTNFDTSRCFATGWGKDNFKNGKYVNILKKIDLPVVPNAKCQRDLRKTPLSNYFKLHSSFMCAGGEPHVDTCKGDGGSPLVCTMTTDPKHYFQVGIVAWGIGCGKENVPAVYASVPYLRSWIDDQLANKKIVAAFYFTP